MFIKTYKKENDTAKAKFTFPSPQAGSVYKEAYKSILIAGRGDKFPSPQAGSVYKGQALEALILLGAFCCLRLRW